MGPDFSEIRIKSFIEFVERVNDQYSNSHWAFRGVKDSESHKLIPSLGRMNIPIEELSFIEKEIFRKFKLKAKGKLEFEPHNDTEWLALAQHHGLPTRLLDWTNNPLVAAFFASQPEYSGTGELKVCCANGSAIYVYEVPEFHDSNETPDPFVGGMQILYSPYISSRIAGQSGLFTLQSNPESEYNYPNIESHIHKLVFDFDVTTDMQKRLYFLGIRQSLLFPDLDGLSNDIKTELLFGGFHSMYKFHKVREDWRKEREQRDRDEEYNKLRNKPHSE